jgi:hypothetical protein
MPRILKYLWALPITVFGLLVVLVSLPSRPTVAWLRIGNTRALCAWGGWLDVWLQKHPFGSMWAAALGHVVVARDAGKLCFCGAHEFEHVRQTERWGILMPLAYVLNGMWQLMRGKRFYRNNCFEEAAYRFGPERFERRVSQK